MILSNSKIIGYLQTFKPDAFPPPQLQTLLANCSYLKIELFVELQQYT